MQAKSIFLGLLLFLSSCKHQSSAAAASLGFDLAPCILAEGTTTCQTVDPSLNELSGMVAHSSIPDLYWVHEDQGSPKIYAINGAGKIIAIVTLNSMEFDDAEDISIGDGPEIGRRYIYVGDIGKSRKKSGTLKLFRFKEPLAGELVNSEISISEVDLIRLKYAGDKQRDFETQLIDQQSGDLFLIEKDGSKVFKVKHSDLMASSDVLGSGSIEAVEVLKDGVWGEKASGGAVSPKGNEILVRSSKTAWLFSRLAGQTFEQALANPVLTIPLSAEFNGEAISFDNQGLDFYTVSENFKKDEETPSTAQPVSHYIRHN